MDETGFVREFSPEKAAAMRRSLQKAIEIKPDFTESYRLLAFLNLVNNENLDESISFLQKGLSLQPGNQEYALLIAQIYMRQEKFSEAKETAQKLAKTASEQYMRANAERILNSINQIETAKAEYEKRREEMSANNTGNRPPTLIRKNNLSEEELAKLEAEREMVNLNRMIEKPKAGEKQTLGYFQKIACPNGEVVYTFKTDTENFTLSSKDFASLNIVALTTEAQDLQVGCGADLQNTLAVITYRPNDKPKAKTKGELTGMHFVPKNFRLKSEAEITESESKQAVLAENEMQNAIEQGIKNAMRQPQEGEKRELGIAEKIECGGKSIFFIIKTETQTLKLKTDSPQSLKIMSFTPEAGMMQFGCGAKLPPVPVVVTFRPSGDGKDKVQGEIVSLEFVPQGFKLN
jgi:tetratricopeptide (TPR) repeat protein